MLRQWRPVPNENSVRPIADLTLPEGIDSLSGGSVVATTSTRFADQQIIAEIHQHRMVLEIKPTVEDIETSVTRPGVFIVEPTRQLLDENLLASRSRLGDNEEKSL
jgi:hypothetical protein